MRQKDENSFCLNLASEKGRDSTGAWGREGQFESSLKRSLKYRSRWQEKSGEGEEKRWEKKKSSIKRGFLEEKGGRERKEGTLKILSAKKSRRLQRTKKH